MYNEVMHVPQKNYYFTYWCCIHALTKPTGVPIAVFTYLLYLPLCLRMCTSYRYTSVLPCWYTCVYMLKKKVPSAPTFIYAGTAPTDVRTACTYCWCTRVLSRRKTTSNERTYSPYVLLWLNAKSTHLRHKLLYLLYVPTTAVRSDDDECIHPLLYVLPVHISST